VALLAACNDPGFETFEEVTKLRTLAISVSPPEIGPGEVAVMRSLTVEPGGAPISYFWEVCLFTEGPDAYYACAETEGLGRAGFDLGTTEEVLVPYDAVIAAGLNLEEVCAALADIPVPDFIELPSCDRGLDVTVRLTVEADGATHISTVPLTLLFADVADDQPRNQNPVIRGLLVGNEPLSVDGVTTVAVPEDGKLRLQLLLNTDEAEQYEVQEGSGEDVVAEREQLVVRWFSTHGRIRRGETYFAEGVAEATELQFNTLNLGAGTEPTEEDRVGIWAVARDTRGGVSWQYWEILPDFTETGAAP
jgi:hypothetical protein